MTLPDSEQTEAVATAEVTPPQPGKVVTLPSSVPARPDAKLDCQVFDNFGKIETLRQEWDQAVLKWNGPIYMTFDWLQTWWEFYGGNRSLRLFIFRENSKIAGLVPIYLDRIGMPLFKLNVARLVGASIPPKIFDPPVDPSISENIWREILQRLFDREACDVLTVGPLADDAAAGHGLKDAGEKNSRLSLSIEQREVQTVYQIPATYDEYFNSLDSKEKKTRRKKLRDLEDAFAIRSEVIREPAAVEKEFEDFVGQHTTQWQSEGRPGHFHAWPRALEYNRELVKRQARLGRVRFFKLMADDQVAANQYTFAFGHRLFAELPARNSGAEWNRYSLGCSSQVKLIQAAIGEGFKRMDSGLGHYEYKILTGGKESPALIYQVKSGSALSAARVALYRKWSALLRLVLQKAWYRRIMPKLPKRFRGGQSELLMRLDL